MALKTLPELQNEIDQAVHTNGPQGKTRAAGLNTVLKSLATELTTQQQETAQALAAQTNLLGKDNTWTGINYFSKGLRFYGGNGFDEYGQLYVNQLVIGNKYSWRNQSFTLAKDSTLMWKPTDYTAEPGAPDVGLARADVGLLEVNTGTPGRPATLTTLDVVALAAPSALNSVAKLAEALTHKADLDAGGRVPSSQLPSYVDDIVEASSFAALPAAGEAGKVYVTLDTNKQYRWAGTAYALLSDSGLTTTVKSGLEAATNPSASNAFATLADIPTSKDVKATLVTVNRQRILYSGTGTVSNTGEDGLKKALAAAQPGDTVQQLSLAKIAVPHRGEEQIRIPAGVNYNTSGFDINATDYSDGLTLVDGTGVINGGNATIYHNVNGSWGIGWYGGGTLDYRIYDLNIHTATDGREYFASPFSIYLSNARIYHTGSIVCSALQAVFIVNETLAPGNQYEHIGPITGLGNCTIFGININGQVIQRGDVLVTENATAGRIQNGSSVTMHGAELNLRNAQPNAGFKLDSTSVLNLIDITVLGDQMPALLNDANQGSGATVHLYGTTVVPDLPWPAGITVVDHRPVSTSSSSIATLPELVITQAGAQIIQLPAGASGVLGLTVREGVSDTVRPLYAADCTVSNAVLTVAANAGLRSGDYISGSYYHNGSGSVLSPAPPAALTLPDLVVERVAEFAPISNRRVQAYEITTNGGISWQQATSTQIPIPVAGISGNTIGVRVAATTDGVTASVATYLPATPAATYGLGLRVRYYIGCWGNDYAFFSNLKPFYEEVVEHAGRFRDPFFDAFAQRSHSLDNFSILFDSFLHIKQADYYSFGSAADDVGAIWIGDALANPSYSNRAEDSGSIYLEAGMHPIRMAYGEYGGAQLIDYYWKGPDVSDIINAGRFQLLTNVALAHDPLQAPPGLLADANFDQDMSLSTWTISRGWDVLNGVLLGTDTDYTTTIFSLPSGAQPDQYVVEVSIELTVNAQLNIGFYNAQPSSTILTTSGIHRIPVPAINGSQQLLLRAENGNLVKVHYAQVLRATDPSGN